MTDVPGRFDSLANSVTTWIVVTIGAAASWIVRRLLINSKQISLLQAEIERRAEAEKRAEQHREQQRSEDREIVRDIGRKVDALYQRGVR